ncbi:MAG: M20/M25/M40 family metallo-hydrolase [Myxococcales bacterium]|nr:M20/M25/M40 family metallo-hydrolase [Myxococcales bacterium]MCB9533242.1 M20/M25/M40 family metallo-hydrolase [Myxococcales bacterium]
MATSTKPWAAPMPDAQFEFMRDVLAAPSPVGYEAAMTFGVLQPYLERHRAKKWAFQRFVGNAGLVLDTHPGEDERVSIMLIGHADKIRLQVRSIGDDGKIWINSDSFLPGTLLGHEVRLFSRKPGEPTDVRVIEGGTVEALGAIHFADAAVRSGDRGIRETQLYLELQIHGENKKAQIEALGIRPGDPLLLHRPIRRGFSPNTFYGAYLDNGLGCFAVAEAARLLAKGGGPKNVRVMFAMASHEEIGRMGSRVLAGELRPDVVIAVDVNHDYVAAPGIGDRRMNPLAMGAGFTLTNGAIVSETLNAWIERAAIAAGIPYQCSVTGRDTGTDGMAGVLASIDCAATSIGFPIRNMHTISESGHTGDVLAAVHALVETVRAMDKANRGKGVRRDDLRDGHIRLDAATPLRHGGA